MDRGPGPAGYSDLGCLDTLDCFDNLDCLIASSDRLGEAAMKTNYTGKHCSGNGVDCSRNRSLEKDAIDLHTDRTDCCSRNVVLVAGLHDYLELYLAPGCHLAATYL